MPRELGDERARYGTKSARERIEDVLGWPSEHPVAMFVIVAFVAVALLLAGARALRVDPADLAVGDCLFVRAGAEGSDVQPIGEERPVIEAVLAGRAEKAACTASHGHEVSAVVDLASLADPAAESQARCQAAFEAFVGRALGASRYLTFAVVPDGVDATAAGAIAVCLVARADGQWMDHPARGSGE